MTINAGKYYGGGSVVQVQKGTAVINGGSFDCEPYSDPQYGYKYMINCIDAAWKDGTAKVSITGGVFAHFDPADSQSEHPNGNFCAPGYKTELTNGVYVVKAGTNDALALVDKAIAEGADAATIKDAIDAVTNTPNETLSSSSTTMDKLAKLEEAYKATNTDIMVKVKNADTVETKVANNGVKNAALSADAGQTVTINVDKDADKQTDAANAIKAATQADAVTVEALDITMKINGTEAQPKAPVVLTFELPKGKENAQIYRIEGNTATKIPTTLNVNAEGKRTISGTFDHFSTYGIQYLNATANDNQYEFILTPDKTDVSAGDEITYTVKLKHISGDSRNVGGFIFAPTIENADLLELVESKCVATGEDVKTSTNTGHFEFTYNKSAGVSVPVGATMDVGMLVYKVKAYGTDNASVAVVGNSSVDQVTSVKLNGSAIPSVSTTKSVTYHVTKVTFQQDEKTSSEFFVPYNGSKLYLNLEDLAADRNEQIAPTLSKDTTGGTAYRVLDENWHLSTNTAELYSASTEFKTSVTYVPLTVNLVEIVLPTNPTVTVNATEGHPLTKRDNRTFVDEGADLNFAVGKNDTNGEKYDVTVKVDDTKVDAILSTNDDGTITGKVDGDAITGKVTFEIKSVLDLTEDDIGIFTKGEDDTLAYREYSSYSGDDTLVLIKGKTGANYTLGAGQPTIYANTAYGNGYTHAVLVPKQNTVSPKAMLEYLVAQGLKTTTVANAVINSTSWDTNGNGNENRDLGDYQATNDFKTYGPNEDWGWAPTDDLLMLADVITLNEDGDKYTSDSYGVARDGWVSDTDVNAFVYLYAHLG